MAIKQIEIAKKGKPYKAPYKFPKYPASRLKPYESQLADTLDFIDGWYSGTSKKLAAGMEAHLRPLVAMFPYKPWNKPVFRAFIVKKAGLLDRLKEGKTYRMVTALNLVQSWTTSASNAARYGFDTHRDNFLVAELVSPGKELSNYDWLRSVAINLSSPAYKNLDFYEDAFDLANRLEEYKYEDEVIMKLKPRNKVKIIFAAPESNNSVRPVYANLILSLDESGEVDLC